MNDVKVDPMLNAIYVDYQPDRISKNKIEETVKRSGYKSVRLTGMKA